jgi:hypothetical protein
MENLDINSGVEATGIATTNYQLIFGWSIANLLLHSNIYYCLV